MLKFTTLIFIFIYCLSVNVDAASNRIIVAKDGSGKFLTIQEAFNAVPDYSTERTEVYVKKGTYREKLLLPASKINVTLTGESLMETVIDWDDFSGRIVGKDTLGTRTSWTFSINAINFIARNITFSNSAGEVGQAVAVMTRADRIMFENCRFLGNQDTFYTNVDGRCYLKNCYIEGTTDFIFGNSVVLFETCHIHCKKNSYITAASTTVGNKFGYVFANCKITADAKVDKMYLGRPWRPFAQTVFLFCEYGNFILPEGWHNWSKPEREKTVFYAEYQCKGAGADFSKRVNWCRQLTTDEAKLFTLKNIFKPENSLVPFEGYWTPGK